MLMPNPFSGARIYRRDEGAQLIESDAIEHISSPTMDTI
jgi:hypothetical protein